MSPDRPTTGDFPPRAVLTLALGPATYRAMAVNLIRSLRRWHTPADLPVTLVTDSDQALPPDLADVRLHVLQAGELGIGFQTKLHLDRLAPARRTLFIDADCLAYGSLDPLFALLTGHAVATIGGAISEGEWFGDVRDFCRKLGVAAIPKFNGGLYYLERGPRSDEVYRRAREMAAQYDALGLVRLRGHPNDELLMAGAMAQCGLGAVGSAETIMSDQQAYPGPLRANVLRGRRELRRPGDEVHSQTASPLLVHYLGDHTLRPPYRAEALRLRLAAQGWPLWLCDAAAWSGVLLPGNVKTALKSLLRPAYHRFFGPRAVPTSPRTP